MNRTVSTPSRITARNDSATRARVLPAEIATSTPRSNSPFSARPCRRIQNSIHVSTPTASTAASPSSVSWTTSGSFSIVSVTATPIPIDRASAARTPAAILGSASRRPILTRYAATMPTMSAASRPSRSIRKKVASIDGRSSCTQGVLSNWVK